jgi:hypothetical protein
MRSFILAFIIFFSALSILIFIGHGIVILFKTGHPLIALLCITGVLSLICASDFIEEDIDNEEEI